MSSIDNAPAGATHCYEHGGMTSWYREVDGKVFVWRDGSWHGSDYMSVEQLMKSCMLGRVTLLAMEQAKPIEDDLTWLARNVHVWPVNAKFAVRPGFGEVLFYECHYSHLAQFPRKQVEARRAELQNKPKWVDAPELAGWLAQSSDGCWFFHERTPTAGSAFWISAVKSSAGHGEVLGDWRDTLEKRPDNIVFTIPIPVEHIKFKVKVSDDHKFMIGDFDNQELATMHSDSGNWFDRGELPPVGTVCISFSKNLPDAKCEIIAYSKEQVAIRWTDNGLLDVVELDDGGRPVIEFRPIRTERDQLTTLLTQAGITTCIDQAADAILAAGFKRGEV